MLDAAGMLQVDQTPRMLMILQNEQDRLRSSPHDDTSWQQSAWSLLRTRTWSVQVRLQLDAQADHTPAQRGRHQLVHEQLRDLRREKCACHKHAAC